MDLSDEMSTQPCLFGHRYSFEGDERYSPFDISIREHMTHKSIIIILAFQLTAVLRPSVGP